MNKILLLFVLCLSSYVNCYATTPIKIIQPESWWVGMKNTELQIVIYGDKISDWKMEMNYAGVSLKQIVRTSNPNYIFLYLNIDASAKAGVMNLQFTNGKQKFTQPYELKIRTRNPNEIKGFDESDLIYMLMPDRFSNGNESNDVVAGMLESKVDRSNPGGRHGGDLQGVI
ncbi:MAG: cyclomaltodextrinase N-terminal domain-containing protein, partial [Chitinophagales bacterium]|nr:cyclomaltodextrinase N-terminal domain-containing protein [Chitinophagales bacterium]